MKKLLLALSMLTFTSVAQAGFMIEPYVGYVTGDSESGSSSSDYTGTTMGGRLGYGVLGFSFGADYGIDSGTAESSNGTETDYDNTSLGVFAAYEFPILLRVYATYIAQATGDIEGLPVDVKGSGTKFGIGWTGLPFVVISLEMSSITYDEADSSTYTLSGDIDVSTTALVLSIPLP